MQDSQAVDEAIAVALEGLVEIAPPDPVSWWPRTAGWFVVGGMLAILLSVWAARRWRRWREDAYRRAALIELAAMERRVGDQGPIALTGLSELLHRTMLAIVPRNRVAGLRSREWFQLLDAAVGRALFSEREADTLIRLTYGRSGSVDAEAAVRALEVTREWIEQHDRDRLQAALSG